MRREYSKRVIRVCPSDKHLVETHRKRWTRIWTPEGRAVWIIDRRDDVCYVVG
jgi:hypothetical protein